LGAGKLRAGPDRGQPHQCRAALSEYSGREDQHDSAATDNASRRHHKANDGARFASAFANLTAACNICHEAVHVGFITIQVPTASPFSNQSFIPKGK
jgi:hypothetical protein